MDVVLHDDVCIELQAHLFSAECEGVCKDIQVIFMDKDGYPRHSDGGDEIRVLRAFDAGGVAGSHCSCLRTREAGASRHVRS